MYESEPMHPLHTPGIKCLVSGPIKPLTLWFTLNHQTRLKWPRVHTWVHTISLSSVGFSLARASLVLVDTLVGRKVLIRIGPKGRVPPTRSPSSALLPFFGGEFPYKNRLQKKGTLIRAEALNHNDLGHAACCK